MNLTKMTAAELKQLRDDVDAAILTRQRQDRLDAKAAAEAVAAEYGFTLADLLRAEKRAKLASSAKYKNPDNPDQTWSGRGRKPGWLVSALEAGADITDLET